MNYGNNEYLNRNHHAYKKPNRVDPNKPITMRDIRSRKATNAGHGPKGCWDSVCATPGVKLPTCNLDRIISDNLVPEWIANKELNKVTIDVLQWYSEKFKFKWFE